MCGRRVTFHPLFFYCIYLRKKLGGMLQFASKQSFALKSVFRIRIQEGKIDPKIALGIQPKIPNLDPESINPDSKHCLNLMEIHFF